MPTATYTPPSINWADLLSQVTSQDAALKANDPVGRGGNNVYHIPGLGDVQAVRGQNYANGDDNTDMTSNDAIRAFIMGDPTNSPDNAANGFNPYNYALHPDGNGGTTFDHVAQQQSMNGVDYLPYIMMAIAGGGIAAAQSGGAGAGAAGGGTGSGVGGAEGAASGAGGEFANETAKLAAQNLAQPGSLLSTAAPTVDLGASSLAGANGEFANEAAKLTAQNAAPAGSLLPTDAATVTLTGGASTGAGAGGGGGEVSSTASSPGQSLQQQIQDQALKKLQSTAINKAIGAVANGLSGSSGSSGSNGSSPTAQQYASALGGGSGYNSSASMTPGNMQAQQVQQQYAPQTQQLNANYYVPQVQQGQQQKQLANALMLPHFDPITGANQQTPWQQQQQDQKPQGTDLQQLADILGQS